MFLCYLSVDSGLHFEEKMYSNIFFLSERDKCLLQEHNTVALSGFEWGLVVSFKVLYALTILHLSLIVLKCPGK